MWHDRHASVNRGREGVAPSPSDGLAARRLLAAAGRRGRAAPRSRPAHGARYTAWTSISVRMSQWTFFPVSPVTRARM